MRSLWEGLNRILNDENSEFKIHEAINGNEAIEKFRHKFDLAVCDSKCPKRRIRRT